MTSPDHSHKGCKADHGKNRDNDFDRLKKQVTGRRYVFVSEVSDQENGLASIAGDADRIIELWDALSQTGGPMHSAKGIHRKHAPPCASASHMSWWRWR
eukprot:979135-Amphidinium_carterae.1